MEEEREAGIGKKRERRIVQKEKGGRQWDVRRDGREGVKKKHGRGGRTGTGDLGR